MTAALGVSLVWLSAELTTGMVLAARVPVWRMLSSIAQLMIALIAAGGVGDIG
ncbi:MULTISPECIES: hypothetical protein [Halomonadaceae]|uniref:hypothetical protein n=1 Tax=Halomonadaceae TaxID=28256 RepID=UPI00159AF7A4|nr:MULTISPECIES: hypothetical protein [Halomonas]QJQ94511.1 hypothetical protein HIO72_03915 [Halomonas sp. PA5]